MYSKTLKTALIVIAFFLAFQNSTHAQFLNKDAVWNVNYFDPGGNKDYSLKIKKDTIINDTIYSVFTRWGESFALREDSDKVFFRLFEPYHYNLKYANKDYLAYDFGLELNDSIKLNFLYEDGMRRDTMYWTVIKVDSVLVGEEYKKRIFLSPFGSAAHPFNHYETLYWVKDVGSNQGPLYFATGISEGEFDISPQCFGIAGEYLYGYPLYDNNDDCNNCSCIYLKANLNSNTIKNPILFNNTLNQIKVGLPTEETCTLSVYSVTGAKIICREIACNRLVTVKPLKPGVYIFNVKTGKTKFSKKIVIQ